MRNSVLKIQKLKEENKKIAVLTAYDYSTAKYIDEAGADIILVGDSLAQVALGYDSTVEVSVDEMLIFTKAVSKGVKNALVVADMPFASFHLDIKNTMENASKFIKVGANAVKMEGSSDFVLENIRHLVQNGIPVMGHLGFTPMSINTLGGHKIQGKDASKVIYLLKEALKLQYAGCFCVVLEMVPKEAASFITKRLTIPTIGIGAGVDCDGQVLVCDDLFGKYDRFTPKFARQYTNLKEIIVNVAKAYCDDVRALNFPSDKESFALDIEELEKLESYK